MSLSSKNVTKRLIGCAILLSCTSALRRRRVSMCLGFGRHSDMATGVNAQAVAQEFLDHANEGGYHVVL